MIESWFPQTNQIKIYWKACLDLQCVVPAILNNYPDSDSMTNMTRKNNWIVEYNIATKDRAVLWDKNAHG